jgi:hypothetical protein
MDRPDLNLDRDEQIRRLMDRFGLSEREAQSIVAQGLGEIGGDITSNGRPLTSDQRRRLGLGANAADDPLSASLDLTGVKGDES